MIQFYLLVFGTTWVIPTPKQSCSESKDDKISSIVVRNGRPCSINPSTGTPFTIDRNGLVLRASRRPTRAPILASLGARVGVLDSSATPSTHRAAAFAVLSAPKRSAFVYHDFDCCAHCRRACVSGILYPLVRLSPPPLAPSRPRACCCRPPLLRIIYHISS